MKYLSVTTIEAKASFTELVNRVNHHHERIVITRRGKEIAALVSMEDFMLLQSSQDKSDLQQALESLTEARNQGTISLEQLKDEMGSDQ